MSEKAQGSLPMDKPDDRLVTISIAKSQNDNSDVYICVNDRSIMVKRGVDAKVPKYMVDSIAELQVRTYNPDTKTHDLEPKYNIQYKS